MFYQWVIICSPAQELPREAVNSWHWRQSRRNSRNGLTGRRKEQGSCASSRGQNQLITKASPYPGSLWFSCELQVRVQTDHDTRASTGRFSIMSIAADKDLQLPLSHMLRWKLRLKVTVWIQLTISTSQNIVICFTHIWGTHAFLWWCHLKSVLEIGES